IYNKMTTAYIKILAELSNADPPDITIPSIPYNITMSIDA
ncbi:7836_t:CDS:1, partial [Gigaspora rosea]